MLNEKFVMAQTLLDMWDTEEVSLAQAVKAYKLVLLGKQRLAMPHNIPLFYL